MGNIQIPSLPGVAAVSDTDLFEAVQSGVSVKETALQIANYVISKYPYPLPSVVTTFSAGTTGLTPNTPTQGDIVLAGTLGVANGGTGYTSLTVHGLLLGNAGSAINVTSAGTTGQVLVGNTGADPTWAAATSVAVTSISFGTTGLTPNSTTQGAVTVGGTLVAVNGGTGLSSYTPGALLYALTTTTLSGLTDTILGNVLLSGGVNTAPSFGKVDLTAAVTGILPAVNGGTGNGTYTTGSLLYANSTTTLSGLTDVALGSILISGGLNAAPSWASATSVVVTSISFGTTGFTPNTTTQGAVTVSGTLIVGNGGTGAATLTGVIKGNGTSAMTAATAGSDYVAPGTATSFTALQTFNGSSSVFAAAFVNTYEPSTVSATAATGTIAFYINSQSVLFYTTNASANWTLNIAFSAGTTLDTALPTGGTVTVTFKVAMGATPYYMTQLQIDGSNVTVKWPNASAPAAGIASQQNIYTFAITKTASATYDILGNLTTYG